MIQFTLLADFKVLDITLLKKNDIISVSEDKGYVAHTPDKSLSVRLTFDMIVNNPIFSRTIDFNISLNNDNSNQIKPYVLNLKVTTTYNKMVRLKELLETEIAKILDDE